MGSSQTKAAGILPYNELSVPAPVLNRAWQTNFDWSPSQIWWSRELNRRLWFRHSRWSQNRFCQVAFVQKVFFPSTALTKISPLQLKKNYIAARTFVQLWTVYCMPLKNKPTKRECYWLWFGLEDSSADAKTCIFLAMSLLQKEHFFLKQTVNKCA